ncbi:MAG: hypothetical protein SPE67_01365, partial [Dialister sp.]|nr:hypothetical protein [Dialister sp.]
MIVYERGSKVQRFKKGGGAALRADFCKRRCPKVVFKSPVTIYIKGVFLMGQLRRKVHNYTILVLIKEGSMP